MSNSAFHGHCRNLQATHLGGNQRYPKSFALSIWLLNPSNSSLPVTRRRVLGADDFPSHTSTLLVAKRSTFSFGGRPHFYISDGTFHFQFRFMMWVSDFNSIPSVKLIVWGFFFKSRVICLCFISYWNRIESIGLQVEIKRKLAPMNVIVGFDGRYANEAGIPPRDPGSTSIPRNLPVVNGKVSK